MKASQSSETLWRSLNELADPQDFRGRHHDEFVSGASNPNTFDRRQFLKVMGASFALASLPACTRQPVEKIVPYVKQPEELIPGKPLYFATAIPVGGFATGLLVESHEGHPTKIEGNPEHPASLGATSVFHQAALLDLYDPNRSKNILNRGAVQEWNDFLSAFQTHLHTSPGGTGGRIRILTETVTSPTLHDQIRSVLKKFPQAKWHQYEPANRDNSKAGAELAFGNVVETHFHLEKAKIVLSLDSDFLYAHPNSLRYTRDFADQRRARFPQNQMNRLYVVESGVSVTGANADHRLPAAWSEIQNLTLHLINALQIGTTKVAVSLPAAHEKWITATAQELHGNQGASIIIVGDNQPPAVHAMAHLLNHSLGNVGNTVTYTESAEADPINHFESIKELSDALGKGEVDTLIIIGGNPVFNAPVDFDFKNALSHVKFSAHLSSHVNETSGLCDWHIPESHFLESWGDARSFDGTVSIIQPLIMPLYDSKSAYELFDVMLMPQGRSDYDIIHDFWATSNAGDDFGDLWRNALHDGIVRGSALPAKATTLHPFQLPSAINQTAATLEATFQPDPTIGDGRYANNGWLQELPKPITKLVWDNAAYISAALSEREKLANGDIIEVTVQSKTVELPVLIVPGQPENTIGLQFGYGRTAAGFVGDKIGSDIYPLRSSQFPWAVEIAGLKKTGRSKVMVTTQEQHVIDSEDRQIVREGTFSAFQSQQDFIAKDSEAPSETLFNPNEYKYDGYRWGMAIDLSACIGCSACVIACQAENNIPVVGKAEVARGRLMHWIRVDSYFRGAPENPEVTHQPVPCMQCENAPCELVCPVGATLHDKEGLNVQVYNRCVGTRYCSNNCPYKVRRFNFFQYADYKAPNLKPLWNPDVTVRWRGVMEKCTYCVQRISAARIGSEEQGKKIADGQVRTACQQVCPAQAITFGDLSDPNSAVSKMKSHPLNFLMLGQLNTRPRTTYLAKLRNPNPLLDS